MRLKKTSLIITQPAITNGLVVNGNAAATGLLTNGIKQDKRLELNPNSSSTGSEQAHEASAKDSAEAETTNGHATEATDPLPDSSDQKALVVNGAVDLEDDLGSKPRDLSYFFCRFCMSYHDLESVIENKIVNSIIQQNALATNSFKTNAELLKNLMNEINGKETRHGLTFAP